MEHGQLSMYTNGRCRCEVCRAAMAAYRRQNREQKASQPLPPWIQHGQHNTYCNYGCRCQACRDAHAVVVRTSYHRRKVATSP